MEKLGVLFFRIDNGCIVSAPVVFWMFFHLFELLKSINQAYQKKDNYYYARRKYKLETHGILLYLIILKYAPNPSIDGTQIPTNKPASIFPLNHKPMDSNMDRRAAISMK